MPSVCAPRAQGLKCGSSVWQPLTASHFSLRPAAARSMGCHALHGLLAAAQCWCGDTAARARVRVPRWDAPGGHGQADAGRFAQEIRHDPDHPGLHVVILGACSWTSMKLGRVIEHTLFESFARAHPHTHTRAHHHGIPHKKEKKTEPFQRLAIASAFGRSASVNPW